MVNEVDHVARTFWRETADMGCGLASELTISAGSIFELFLSHARYLCDSGTDAFRPNQDNHFSGRSIFSREPDYYGQMITSIGLYP